MVSGSYEKVQLSFRGKNIGILDPRGAFGDTDAQREVELQIKKLSKCVGTDVLTEPMLNATNRLPAIYGESLEESHLQYLAENTDLDYLIYIVTGPGRLTSETGLFPGFGADREGHAYFIIYDLPNEVAIKTITVNGTLNVDDNKRWYETEYSERDIGHRSIKKGFNLLFRFSDCR